MVLIYTEIELMETLPGAATVSYVYHFTENELANKMRLKQGRNRLIREFSRCVAWQGASLSVAVGFVPWATDALTMCGNDF